MAFKLFELKRIAQNRAKKIMQLLKEKDNQLKETLRFQTIFQSIGEGVLTLDNNCDITSLNPAGEKILGINLINIHGKKCSDIFNFNICQSQCPFKSSFNDDMNIKNYPVKTVLSTGKKLYLSVNSAPNKDKNNNIIGIVLVFRDVTEMYQLREQLQSRYKFENIVGSSKKMLEVYKAIENISSTNVTVLILGETGTGKELVARAIHYNGNRKLKPFISVNCSALSESLLESELFGHVKGSFTDAVSDRIGRFEMADEGTLFLDEIGDINTNIQTKLLKVIETKEFEKVGSSETIKTSARIIVATNKDLSYEMKMNRFRNDLFYRLNTVTITLPSLRERKEDIYYLIQHFMTKFKEKYSTDSKIVSSETFTVLYDYNWPGNIRELEHCIEYAFIHSQSDTILPIHLPKNIYNFNTKNNIENQIKSNASDVIKENQYFEKQLESNYETNNDNAFILNNPNNRNNNDSSEQDQDNNKLSEKEIILKTLNNNKWNKKKSADVLNISRPTLYKKIKKYNLE